MPIPRARESFGGLVGTVASRRRVACRRSTPVAVLPPQGEYAELAELHQRDQQIAVVLRGRGVLVEPWSTTKLIEAPAKGVEQR